MRSRFTNREPGGRLCQRGTRHGHRGVGLCENQAGARLPPVSVSRDAQAPRGLGAHRTPSPSRTSSPHRRLDRPRYKASCASASCGCHAESLLIEYECGSREGTRRAQSHVEEGRSLGLRMEWKRAHGPRTVGTSRTGGRRPASPICVRITWRTRQRTTNNEGTLSHSFNAGLLILEL
jgi:hypothetical protein